MLNIKVQCCGILMVWLITCFYWRLPRMAVRTKKTFFALLIVSNVCILTDVLSVAAIYYSDVLPDILVRISCKVYLYFLLSLIFCGLMYLCSDICKSRALFTKKVKQYGIPFFVAELLIFVLPIDYVCEDGGNVIYSFGPSTIVAYVFFVAVFIVMLVHLYIGRKDINPRRRMAVGFWLAIWLVSAGVQFLNSSLLVVSFAGCLGVIIIFSMIENPELSLDRESNFFHTSAMIQYMSELYGGQKSFILICMQFYKQYMDFYKEIRNAEVFVGGGEVYFLFFEREPAEKLLEQLTERFYKQSIYIVWDSGIAESSAELLLFLKEAQQVQRGEQRNNVCILDHELKQGMQERKKTEELIQKAIQNDRIEVFYQPIYSIKEEKFQSAEALMRIRDEEGKLVPPNVFIPVAEDNGSILELGKMVFDKVCCFLKQYEKEAVGLHYIEVNLSVVQGENKFLAEEVLETMERYHVCANHINLEITESASITGKKQLLKTMGTLETQGITFSLDDFGTGQCNLDYMASMPVQIVKFDRTMTQNYFESEKTRCIMDAAIQMIHDIDMKIVAEGIETKEQLERMQEKGIDYIQGYYFSKPLPEMEFLDFIKLKNGKS